MDRKLKHLDLIQGTINRMGQCSFLLKGWSVVLISGLFALAAKDTNPLFVYLAYLPGCAFWILDGYYLYQERLYRNLYDHIRSRKLEEIDFAMDASPYKGQRNATLMKSVFSRTLVPFYGVVILTITVATLACCA